MSETYDVVIVGSGPAGYTAALYAARANLDVLVFQGFEVGGQLMLTSDVENYPGYKDGVMGPDMMDDFEAQAARFGAKMRPENVERVDLSERPFKLWAEGEEEPVLAKSVVIATGAKAKWLGLPGEQRLMGRGVSGCATCDGFFFKDKKVAVVGGGDTAMEEATFLSKFASEVILIHRRDQFRASKIMLDRARNNPKITRRVRCGRCLGQALPPGRHRRRRRLPRGDRRRTLARRAGRGRRGRGPGRLDCREGARRGEPVGPSALAERAPGRAAGGADFSLARATRRRV
jgi:thioredoxin reductase